MIVKKFSKKKSYRTQKYSKKNNNRTKRKYSKKKSLRKKNPKRKNFKKRTFRWNKRGGGDVELNLDDTTRLKLFIARFNLRILEDKKKIEKGHIMLNNTQEDDIKVFIL